MSKGVDRIQVFRTTRVRTVLKNDCSWIHKPKNDNEEEDKAGTSHDAESKPSPVRQNSYVLLTAKKFGSIDSSVIPPFQTTEVTPAEGPQEECIETGKAQPEKLIAESKQENGEAPADPSNADLNEAKVSADAHEENVEKIFPVDGTIESEVPTAPTVTPKPPVEPSEQPLASSTAENKEENGEALADPSNAGLNEAKVSADANGENVEEIPPVDGTFESNGTTEVPTAPTVEPKPQEESLIKEEPENAKELEDGGELSAQPEGESCENCPTEQAKEESVSAAADVILESLPETTDVTNSAPGEKTSLQVSAESVPDILESVSKSPTQPAVDTATEVCCDKSAEPDPEEIVDAVAEIVVESSPETPAVNNATPEEPAAHTTAPPVPDIVSEQPVPPAADTTAEVSCDKFAEPGPEEIVEAVAEVVVESSSESFPVNNATPEEQPAAHNTAPLVLDIVSKPFVVPVAEATAEVSCEKHSAEPGTEETVEAVAEDVVESSPETPAINNATQVEVPAVHNAAPPVTDIISEPPISPAAEPVVRSVKCEVESAALAETVLKTTAEEIVECEVQSVDSTAVEQSFEPPESAVDGVVELDIKDALEPAAASEAEAVQDKIVDQATELRNALDVEPPTAGTVPKQSEESKLNHQQDKTNISEVFQKPTEELISPGALNYYRNDTGICSFCDQIINGNVRITLSDPPVKCHPECLKCGICALALGDLLTPMFFRGQVIQCGGCVREALKI